MSEETISEQIRCYGHTADIPLLLLHPWWGVTPAVIEWAEFLAAQNRRVFLIDFYKGRTVNTLEDAEQEAERILDDPQTLFLLEHTADILTAQKCPWTAMGFSLGAFLACHLAGRGIAAPNELILFYGGQPPNGDTSYIRRIELHIVPHDDYFTQEEFVDTRNGFITTGSSESEIEIYHYDNSKHWFAERGSPNFNEKAYNLARSRVARGLMP